MYPQTEPQNPLLLAPPAETDCGVISQASEKGHRAVPLLVWLTTILTLVVIPLTILSYGYLPVDDALRHVAKAVSGREWSDVMVIQDQFKMDHNPGWHWILGKVHEATGAGPEALIMMSVCGLTLLIMLVPLGWVRRPEAWIAALLIGTVIFPGLIRRYYLARPFVISVAVTLTILLLWRRPGKPTPVLLAVSTILFALAAWLHGSWYLFALLLAAFALAGQLTASFWVAACWLGGSFLGALFTGHPITFLWNAIQIGSNAFGQHQLQRMLVFEFRPITGGAAPVILLAGALLILRGATGKWNWKTVHNPIFILFVMGWVLGLHVSRFWWDWGLPAFSLWMALELHDYAKGYLAERSFRRLGVNTALCVALFLAATANVESRWTHNINVEYLTETNPQTDPWLPDDGGILYCADMAFFYSTYFKNPHGKWRYALGFEPSFMPAENLRIYRNIQWNYYSHASYQPWVDKMRPEDRLVIPSTDPAAPGIPGLEWKLAARDTWVGRLAREAAGSKPLN